ncbi:hypothetical protein [Ponticoccus litoralis]|uniref:Antifreeze protein n=1 Tax=Ponticoccus litoralis TaxID=422297 RepID=A0AAW9S9R8_9RHOB
MTETQTRDPFAVMRLSTDLAWMTVEAGAVIWMRSLGMVGLWRMSESEPLRMVAEKQGAFAEAGRAACSAAWRGAAPEAALAAALRPLRIVTRSNAHRLARRDPAPHAPQ